MAIATACKQQAFREALLKKIVGEDVTDLVSVQPMPCKQVPGSV